MDTTTLLEIIERVELALSYTKADKDFKEDYTCGSPEEYKAYVMGQHDALQATLGHLQSYIEGELNTAENTTEQ